MTENRNERLTVDASLRVARSNYSLEATREAAEVLATEVERLRAVVPEVQCPSCLTTIRARLADQPGALDAAPHGGGPMTNTRDAAVEIAMIAAADDLVRRHT